MQDPRDGRTSGGVTDLRGVDERMLTDERIDYAAQEAATARLSPEQVAGMQAFLLGATLTHFDESPIVPMTDAHWRRLVRAAIAEA